MKKSKKDWLLTMIFLAAVNLELGASSPGDTLRITLDDALKIALSENITVKIADQEIIKQQYVKNSGYGALFPQIDFNGNYQLAVAKQVMYLDGIPGMDEGMPVGRDHNWSLGFSASMPLVSAVMWKGLKVSAYDVELAIEKAHSSRTEMTDQVKSAFYGVLLAKDAYQVYKEVYDNALDNYNHIRQKYEEGLYAEYDYIRADVNVKNAEPKLYDAENTLILAHWYLKALLGLDLESPVQCLGALADHEVEILEDVIPSGSSLENNSMLKQIEIQQLQLRRVKQMRLAQYYPSLYLSFNYMWNSMSNDWKFRNYNWDPYSMLGLTLSIPIFSGGQRLHDVKQTQISINQLALQRQDAERNLHVAVKQAEDQMATSIKQYHAARAGVVQSEKGYAISLERYNSGGGTILEINDSQLSLTQARLNLNHAIYNYLIAKSSLEKLIGNK